MPEKDNNGVTLGIIVDKLIQEHERWIEYAKKAECPASLWAMALSSTTEWMMEKELMEKERM